MLFAADKYFTKSSLYKVLIINFFIKFIKSFVVDFIILYHISDLVWIFRAHCYHTLSLDSSSDR